MESVEMARHTERTHTMTHEMTHEITREIEAAKSVAREIVYAERKGDTNAASAMRHSILRYHGLAMRSVIRDEYELVHAEMRAHDARHAHDNAKRALFEQDDLAWYAGDRQYDHPLTVMLDINACETMRAWDDAVRSVVELR